VTTPLAFTGSYFGFRAERIIAPTKTNQIERYIPREKTLHNSMPVRVAIGGLLPFGSVFIELYFIMGALWLHQIYYVMGFVLAVLIILSLSCAMVSIVLCYLQLCSEDYRWWWNSFWTSASAGIYLFLYSLWYLTSQLDLVGFLPVVVYLTYMGIISMAFSLYCGSIGLLSSFWFCLKIYDAVKID